MIIKKNKQNLGKNQKEEALKNDVSIEPTQIIEEISEPKTFLLNCSVRS